MNLEALKDKISDSGMTIVAICKKCGISRETLYNRFNLKGEFKASEIELLTKTLRLTKEERDDIFFTNNSELNSTNKAG